MLSICVCPRCSGYMSCSKASKTQNCLGQGLAPPTSTALSILILYTVYDGDALRVCTLVLFLL